MGRYWLTPELAGRLLATIRGGGGEVLCSLDLGLSQSRVAATPGGAQLGTADPSAVLGVAELTLIAESARGCFVIESPESGGGALCVRGVHIAAHPFFYKLIPTDEAPTIEISGIQMHRTTGTAPFENAMNSARSVVRKGMRVLDTCGGLGYTAIAAARLGAASVVSVEVDPNVRAIARQNPWSVEYFTNPVITLVLADAAAFVASQADGVFDCVIHDPPRFSRAGALYGSAFYMELARVLRPGGTLFHYTGEPYSRGRGRAFVLGVARRLTGAGFDVRRADALQGLIGRLRRRGSAGRRPPRGERKEV